MTDELGPQTAAALDAAKGDRKAAAAALGIKKATLYQRIGKYYVKRGKGLELLHDWLQRTWPQAGGHKAVKVLRVEYEGTGYERERVYVLAAHGDVEAGEHVNRVPAVGVVRARVVCKACKEASTG